MLPSWRLCEGSTPPALISWFCCVLAFSVFLGVQIEYDVVDLRTSLVQLFALLQLNLEEVVQIIELRRFGGAPNGYPFAASKCFSPSALG
jgi:hypothetical protein